MVLLTLACLSDLRCVRRGCRPRHAKRNNIGAARFAGWARALPEWKKDQKPPNNYLTEFTKGVSPWMRTSRRSPEVMGPTPLGVPVMITSPGRRVMLAETKLTRCAQLKMSWLVLEFWRSWPF